MDNKLQQIRKYTRDAFWFLGIAGMVSGTIGSCNSMPWIRNADPSMLILGLIGISLIVLAYISDVICCCAEKALKYDQKPEYAWKEFKTNLQAECREGLRNVLVFGLLGLGAIALIIATAGLILWVLIFIAMFGFLGFFGRR